MWHQSCPGRAEMAGLSCPRFTRPAAWPALRGTSPRMGPLLAAEADPKGGDSWKLPADSPQLGTSPALQGDQGDEGKSNPLWLMRNCFPKAVKQAWDSNRKEETGESPEGSPEDGRVRGSGGGRHGPGGPCSVTSSGRGTLDTHRLFASLF